MVKVTFLAWSWGLFRIMENKLFFEEVSFAHVYREFNHKVDQLSKEALILENVFWLVHEIKNHTPTYLILLHQRKWMLTLKVEGILSMCISFPLEISIQ
jgi:hypothetical protein